MSGDVALEIRDLRIDVAQNGNDIVDEITLTIARGQVLGLVGESGSGKTTVGLAVLGHARSGVRINSGTVTIEGREILSLDRNKLRSARGRLVTYVPQDGDRVEPGAAWRQLSEVLDTQVRASTPIEWQGAGVAHRGPCPALRIPSSYRTASVGSSSESPGFVECRPSHRARADPGLDVTTQAMSSTFDRWRRCTVWPCTYARSGGRGQPG